VSLGLGSSIIHLNEHAARIEMTEQALPVSFVDPPDDRSNHAVAHDAAAEVQCDRVGASLARSKSDTTVIVPIRHKLRSIVGESGPGKGFVAVTPLRPLVAQAHDILRERFEAGGSADDYLRDRAKLADDVVVGLLQIASISHGTRNRSMVAPLAAMAVGGYGRRELAPCSDLDLVFLLPESNGSVQEGIAPATKACINSVVTSLWDLGFVLDHATRSARECLELAKDNAAVLAGLVSRRYLWGGFGLFTSLDTNIAHLLSGPEAGRWRAAVTNALSSTPCNRSHEKEDEPDLKRGPGGLRDLQRAMWTHASISKHNTPLTRARLIEAHRFLWLLRCHLHLEAGRAEERLGLSLQPRIARRFGLNAPQKFAAASLLNLFRHHAGNVLAAIGAGPGAL
jgi:UTP:GlnB (protein PII) uridylyltransferase